MIWKIQQQIQPIELIGEQCLCLYRLLSALNAEAVSHLVPPHGRISSGILAFTGCFPW